MRRRFVAAIVSAFALVVAAPAAPTQAATADQAAVHHRHYYKHHPECHSAECARKANARWNEHMRKLRERREAREAAEGWAIPTYIVMCESKGQNLAPNSAGASGYYQIIVSTWLAYGGGRYASEAWLASKAEQSIVARAIWNGGGPSQWVCA